MTPRPPALAFVGLVLGASCAQKPPPTLEPEAVPPRGAATYTFLFDPSQEPALADGQELESPHAVGSLALPAYPAEALAAGAGPATVCVRILIDHDGRVAEVLDSPKGVSSAGPFAGEFRSAVETAVRSWAFTGGEIRDVAPGNDVDGDGRPDDKVVLKHVPVIVRYDVRFDFAIVDGRGVVTSDGAPEPRPQN